jgi:acyl carrier protein
VIVAGLLGLERVGVNENFFYLGGNSLFGTQLIARLRDAFGVDVPLLRLFDLRTVANLAAEIERLLVTKVEAMSEDEVQRLLELNTN